MPSSSRYVNVEYVCLPDVESDTQIVFDNSELGYSGKVISNCLFEGSSDLIKSNLSKISQLNLDFTKTYWKH